MTEGCRPDRKTVYAISKGERRWAEWAIDPMLDFWCSDEEAYARDGQVYPQNALPHVVGNALILSDVDEINEDLLYRLEIQAPDVCETDASSEQQVAARARCAVGLAKKIRNALGWQDRKVGW